MHNWYFRKFCGPRRKHPILISVTNHGSYSNQINSNVLFKVCTFTNSTNISSHELFKPTCILRYKLQHNKTMSCIKTTYQAKIRCKHINGLISGPPKSVHMWQALLCTLTVIGPENSIEIDADNYSIYYTKAKYNQICHCPK